MNESSELDLDTDRYERQLAEESKNFQALVKLGKLYLQTQKIDLALEKYQQALAIRPRDTNLYFHIINILEQQDKTEETIDVYKDLIAKTSDRDKLKQIYKRFAEFLLQRDRLEQSIQYYYLASELEPDPDLSKQVFNKLKNRQDLSLYIWNFLNSFQPEWLKKIDFFLPKQIPIVSIKKCLESVTKYTIINLDELAKTDRLLLEELNFSLKYLKPIFKDSIHYQKRYVKKFGCDVDLASHQSLPNNSIKANRSLIFQDFTIATDYIYIPCPITGKILRSNQSFFINGQLGIYRFVGEQIFYLIVYGPAFIKSFLFFPDRELIITPTNSLDPVKIINIWKILTVANWHNVCDYICSVRPKKLVLLHGWMDSIAHYLWNELSGIQRLVDNSLIAKVDKILIGQCEYYAPIEQIFPEIPAEKIVRVPQAEIKDIYKTLLDNKYFALKVANNYIQQELANRIYRISLEHCHASFLEQIKTSKQNFPLIWITIRTGRRLWLEQVEGTVKLLKEIALSYPNLGIVIDGVSLSYRNELLLGGREEEMLKNDLIVAQQILDLLEDTHINVYNSVGCRMYESIVWANNIDFYIVPFGGGMAKITYLANKPGIVHSNHTVLNSFKNNWYNASQRENGIEPTYIPAHFITEVEETDCAPLNKSYHCDWQVIYDEAMKTISQLKRASS
jgi:tetratricopeptide (TPR) repeat protein